MAKQTTKKSGHSYTPDDVIGDYLGELLGEVLPENKSGTELPIGKDSDDYHQSGLDLLKRKIISDGHHLIPTFKIGQHHIVQKTESKRSGSLAAASGSVPLIILLNLLYFLRRPLSPMLRQVFLEKAGDMVTELRFAQSFSGELSES